MRGAAGFMHRGAKELGLGFGNQSPEKTAVAFSGSAAFAYWRTKLELNAAPGLHRRGEPDSSDPAAGNYKYLIRHGAASVVQRTYNRSKTDRHPVDARDCDRANSISQIDPILVSEQSRRWRSRRAFVGSRLQEAGAASTHGDIVRRVVNSDCAGGIKDAVYCRRADVDDLQRSRCDHQRRETEQQRKN